MQGDIDCGLRGIIRLRSSMHGIEEYLVAGAIVLEMFWKDGYLARSLIVEKMRCTSVKPTQLEFDIEKGQGIVIQPAL